MSKVSDPKEPSIQSEEISEHLRMLCPSSRTRFGGKRIMDHYCDRMRLCRNLRSVFVACRIHNIQIFSNDPNYVVAFIQELEDKKNGKVRSP